MNLQQRLHQLEYKTATKASEGLPLRPMGMSDTDYEQAIIDKRQELGLKDNEHIGLLDLCMQKVKNPDGTTSFVFSDVEGGLWTRPGYHRPN